MTTTRSATCSRAGSGPPTADDPERDHLPSTSSRGRYRDVLRQRDYRRLIVSAFVDKLGSWSYTVVLAVYVYGQTHSPTWVATICGSRWVVGLVLSGYGGTIADRYERTRVMIGSALASGFTMSGIAVVIGTHAPVGLLVPLTMIGGAAASPYQSAAGSLLPDIVSETDLAAANALFSVTENVVVVLGPALGGLLLALGPPVIGAAVNAASYFIAVALVVQLGVRSRGSAERGESIVRDWLSGFQLLLQQQETLGIVLFSALDSAVYGASSVLFAPLSVRLGTGINGYSYLLAGGALGGVIAAGMANRLSARIRLAPVIGVSILAQAIPFALTAATHTPAVAFILQVVSGVGMVVVDVLGITALQRRVANEQLGRVLGAFQATITAAVVAASFIVSAVISSAGVVAGLLVTGLAVPALGAWLFPLLVRADRLSAATAEQLRGRVSLLERLDLFEGTASAVLERLAAAAEPVSLPARSVVIREGDPADALWILVEGSLSVRATGGPAGSQQLPTVNAPSYVGELGLVHGVPRTATVRTREPSELLRIDGDTFLDALNSAPPSGSMVKLSGDRWQRTARRRNLDGSAVQRAASAIGFAGGSTEPAQQAGDRR